jgi:phosphoglycerol transferase MdoB-like AlkP superfamily enzyme
MNKENGRKYALWGAWLQVGAVIGLIWTVIGMISSFQKVLPSGAALANEISNELTPVLFALVASFIGAILLAVALFVKKYRAAWFFWFLLIYGILITMNLGAGTVIGGLLIIYLIYKKDEFLESKRELVSKPV